MEWVKRCSRGVLVVLTLCVLGLPGAVHAQSDGLGISPRKDYTIRPGSKMTDTLYLSNLSKNQPLQVAIRVVDFKAQDQTGTPALQLASNAQQTSWSLRPFIHIPATVSVAAGQYANVPFTISIPKGQGAGSYYSAIEYTAQTTGGKSTLNVAASSATLVFVTVPGQAHELLNYENFGAFVPNVQTGLGTYKTWFFGAAPQELAYTLQNNGDVAEDPQGSIVVKNIFGRTVKVIQKANPRNSLALIGQTRLFQACLSNTQQPVRAVTTTSELACGDAGLWPGYYNVQLTALYGISGGTSQAVAATATFWYVPWWSLAAFILILAVLAICVGLIYRRLEAHGRSR